MDKEQLMKNAKLLQSVLLTYTLGEMSDEHLKGNLKTIANNINPNIMDIQIKFYNKAEGCSFANRFVGFVTLAHLIEGINFKKFKIVTGTDFSEPLGMQMTQNVLDINGNKAAGVVLEDGTQVIFRTKQSDPDYLFYRISGPDYEWAELLNKECIKKEDADPDFIHLP